MITVGNQTACWAANPTEPFDYAVAQGFDAFEWFPDRKPGAGWDPGDLDPPTRQAIVATASARGIRLSVHARSQAHPLSSGGYALLWEDLALAQDLEARLLNIHLVHDQGLAAFVEALLPLVRRTAESGIRLAIENTPQHTPELFNELFARLRALISVETRHVGMCLDVGHANLSPATRNDYLRFCDRLDPQAPIIHLHLHENWGDADTHLPLFTGPSAQDESGIRGLIARLKQRRYSGAVILEQWPSPPALLNQARDRLLELWSAGEAKSSPESERKPPSAPLRATPAPPEDGLAGELVAGDQKCPSWRDKLELVRGLLAQEHPALTADELIDVAIYLRFLGTGEIACREDGRHFRPAHHARIGSQIRHRLAQLRTPESEFVVRKIYPWLPSSAPAFQRPEPLTRIRDIAHRNDIPSDLKHEIKTTLQNKLHRCAGPEDLATATALLERFTDPAGNYPPAFVEQFKIFHEELREFFNARSLEERLQALLPEVDSAPAGLIRQFLNQNAANQPGERRACFQTLTALREALTALLERHADTDEFLLADIALEDRAFVLLSEIINDFEHHHRPDSDAESATGTLILALHNLVLSRIEQAESHAVENELRAWGSLSPATSREEILRLKATLLRCRRLAEVFSARVAALFSGRVEKLGRALGVPDHAIRTYAESEIRSHLVFQVSKLAGWLLRQTRARLGLPAWDVLVSGRAVGRLMRLASLDSLERSLEAPVILMLRSAAGDEEIPHHVTGIVLAHDLPHLSHLGVRARQAGVVFVTCEETSEWERLQGCEGQLITLLAGPDQVTWTTGAGSNPASVRTRQPSPRLPAVRLAPRQPWMPLEHATPETAGGKAAGVRRLAELSRQDGSGFECPASLVVPFGVMEAALSAAPALETEYRRGVERLAGLSCGELAAATRHLRDLIAQVAVPDTLVAEVCRRFDRAGALIVRSSANGEDLEEFAGAGLYESVLNVPPAEVASAIRRVWGSLWTERAALSRREAGLPQGRVHMAVLIQELLAADVSFVLHTVNPVSQNERELYAEVVVGLGETLVSAAARGHPYRLTVDTASGTVVTLAFANFSQASRPNPGGGLRRETVDYSQIDLSREPKALAKLGRRLAAAGLFVARAFGKPQDIEGAVVQDRLYLVQTRPQQGLATAKRP